MLMQRRAKAIVYAGVGLLFLVLGALACEPDNMRARDLPVWTCPTAVPPATWTPEPTSTALPGEPEPTPVPTYTPYPTSTPFVLMSDFPLGKHVRIGSVGGIGLGIWVWMDNVQVDGPFLMEDKQTGASIEWWVASWDVTVENASWTRDYEFYPQMQLYIIEVIEADGMTYTKGAWGPSGAAADLIDLPHLQLTEEMTLLHPGDQVTVRAAALIPAPEVWRLGYVLDPLDTVDIQEMLSAQSLGSNVGIWINAYDNTCIGEITPGVPGTPGTPPAYGYLLARHPVGTVNITRGYGCSADYTGEMATGCEGATPWWHNGVDYAIAKGSSYFDAAADAGSVQYAGDNAAGPDCSSMAGSEAPHNGYGNYVKHIALVSGHQLQIWGAHLSAFNAGSGDPTSPNQVLGFTGSTGCSTGPHLHFSVKVDGLYVDPLTLIP